MPLDFNGDNPFVLVTKDDHGNLVISPKYQARNIRDSRSFAKTLATARPGQEFAIYERREIHTGRVVVDVEVPIAQAPGNDHSTEVFHDVPKGGK